jgi:two-component system response regulator HydG
VYAHRVDLRVVAATNRDLKELAAEGRFRADLYYRISGVEILVPPLRERRSDVPLLVDHFMGRLRRGQPMVFAPDALEALIHYDWPGNVRQLARVVERAVALAPGNPITLADLPTEISRVRARTWDPFPAEDMSLRDWTRRYARVILERCEGNKRRACEILGITYHTLNTYLEQSAPAEGGGAVETLEILAELREHAS